MTLRQEIWHQDPIEQDLWLGANGLLVNTAALEERTSYYEIVRVHAQSAPTSDYEPLGERAL